MRAEQITDRLTHHGEGPVWDARGDRLLWVDLLAGDVLAMRRGSSVVERTHVASVAACVVPRRGGGLVVATERGFSLLAADGTAERLSDVWDDPTVRMNDGACDPQGRFYCGSMGYDELPGRGALYRLDPDRSVEVVWPRVAISNGLGWTADGSTAYYVDSLEQRIDVFDYDPALGFGERRTFVEIAPEIGTPDGLTVDAEGGVWVALWGGSAVRRYAADGRLADIVEIPARQPTSCVFGGEDLTDLYVTTSALRIPRDEIGRSGALFHLRPGVRGLATLEFAG